MGCGAASHARKNLDVPPASSSSTARPPDEIEAGELVEAEGASRDKSPCAVVPSRDFQPISGSGAITSGEPVDVTCEGFPASQVRPMEKDFALEGTAQLPLAAPVPAQKPAQKPALGLLLPTRAIMRAPSSPPAAGKCGLEECDYEHALQFIAKVPVLRRVPQQDLPLLVQAMTKQNYAHGEHVINQGDINDRLFIIAKGRAEIVRCEDVRDDETGAAAEVRLMNLVAGDYFGEQELLHAKTSRATVRAAATGTSWLVTLSVSHDSVWQLGLHKWLCIPRRHAVVDLKAVQMQSATENEAGAALAVQKTDSERCLISAALRANEHLASFCTLTDELVGQLVAVAARHTVAPGEVVMRQGDTHTRCFCIVQHGTVEICGHGRRGNISELSGSWEARVSSGGSFGELELLYSAPCMATVTAVEPSSLWVINNSKFVNILHEALEARLRGYVDTLRMVDLFGSLFTEELRALAEALVESYYVNGQSIVTQGEMSSTFYILIDGEAAVIINGEIVQRRSASKPRRIADFFGEEEILRPGPRLATVQVTSEFATVLALDKATFDIILKPLDELLRDIAEMGDARETLRDEERDVGWWPLPEGGENISRPGTAIAPGDLELHGHLGAGAFGSVELAVHRHTRQRYALKRVRRCMLKDPWACRQIDREKRILSMTYDPFVVRLHGTFRDSEFLSFLLEYVPGGDLLRALCLHELYHDESCARFFAAGIALALNHLHERRILHRDLKPENLLLDGEAWPKLSDFGLAKFCIGRAFTVCGTLPYMAPETLLQSGQSAAVDWWALAVLTYEMMANSTPFESADGDDAKLCAGIKRGIAKDADWPWPEAFGSGLRDFITAMLQPQVSQRLPVLMPGGLSSVQGHSWFRDFDWASYTAKKLVSPCAGSVACPPADAPPADLCTPMPLSQEPWEDFSLGRPRATSLASWDVIN